MFKPLMIKMFFDLLKGPDPNHYVLKFGDDCQSSKRDMAQSVLLQGYDFEKSRSSLMLTIFCKTIRTISMSIHVKFHWDPMDSFSITVEQSLTERWPEEKKEEI